MEELLEKISWSVCSPLFSCPESLMYANSVLHAFRYFKGEERKSRLEALLAEMDELRARLRSDYELRKRNMGYD